VNFFGKIFNTLGHAVAWFFTKALPIAGTVAQDAVNVVESPAGQALAGLLGSKGQAVAADVNAIAGAVIAARNELGDAFAAKFADLVKDEFAVKAVERVFGEVASLVTGKPQPAPAPTVQQ